MMKQSLLNNSIFNPRTAGGGGHPPRQFFVDSEKTAVGSAAKFRIAIHGTLLQID